MLEASIRRHATFPYRFVAIVDHASAKGEAGPNVDVVVEPVSARPLTRHVSPEGGRFPSSYRRLWLFSEAARELGPRILLTDVDAVAVGDLAPLLELPDDFVGWRPRMVWGEKKRLAGGMWLLRTGTRPHVYEGFNGAAAIKRARAAGFRGSDQAWISYCLADKATVWPAGAGVYSVRDWMERDKLGKPLARSEQPDVVRALPRDARIVHFNGPSKAWHAEFRAKHPWITDHWRL